MDQTTARDLIEVLKKIHWAIDWGFFLLTMTITIWAAVFFNLR